jgi:hypothetical protein
VKESKVGRRLREIAQWSDEAKASFAGVSVVKWKVMLREERLELLRRAIRKEK